MLLLPPKRAFFSVCTGVGVLTSLSADVLLEDDFESGLVGWKYVDNSGGSNPDRFTASVGHDGSGGSAGGAGHVGNDLRSGPNNTPGAWVEPQDLRIDAREAWSLTFDLRLENESAIDDGGLVFGDLDGGDYYFLLLNEVASNNSLFYHIDNARVGATLAQYYDESFVDDTWYQVRVAWEPVEADLEVEISLPGEIMPVVDFNITLDGASPLTPNLADFSKGVQIGFGVFNDRIDLDNVRLEGQAWMSFVEARDDVVTVAVGGAIAFDPLANDEFGEVARVEIVEAPSAGTAEYDQDRRKIVYTHTQTDAGDDFFVYELTDDQGAKERATVSVTVTDALRVPVQTLDFPERMSSPDALRRVDALPGLTFHKATAMASEPGNEKGLFIPSLDGSIWYVPDTAAEIPQKHKVLDLSSLSNFVNGRSIYSMVCFPDFARTGHIAVTYQGDGSRLPPVEEIPNLEYDGVATDAFRTDLRVSRFTLSAEHLEEVMDEGLTEEWNATALSTELPYLNTAMQGKIHSIGDIHFGPRGYLYVGYGDEGGQDENHRNGQFITKDQFTSIIRIDVFKKPGGLFPNPHYSVCANGEVNGDGESTIFTGSDGQEPNFYIPVDNPFVLQSEGGSWDGIFNGHDLGNEGLLEQVRTEIWATGFRNPFKFHLDVADDTGEVECWIGDVGRFDREEITVAQSGDNGGWSYWEGTFQPGFVHAQEPQNHKLPLYEYGRSEGDLSVTGGVIYRGHQLPQFDGKYLFGDFASGRVWSLAQSAEPMEAPLVVEYPGLRLPSNRLVDFHRDPASGSVFLLEYSGAGKVWRIEEDLPGLGLPETLEKTGLFADVASLTPNPGLVPYEPNLSFWSDGALKSRWFALPDGSQKMTFSSDQPWQFPVGMVWVKHFDYDLDRDQPGQNTKRLETRVLVRSENGSYGMSYRWNEEGTAATLVSSDGEDLMLEVVEDGAPENFKWRIPSHAECATCHNADAGHALSMSMRQLNRLGKMARTSGNLIDLLGQAGYLENLPADLTGMARHFQPDDTEADVEVRVRSYLDVNCAYCHQPGGSAPVSWDARASLSLADTGMLYGETLSETAPNDTDHLIRIGDKTHSAIWNRINARDVNGRFNNYTQMPPLGSNRVDSKAIALIAEWIDNYANVPPALGQHVPSQFQVSENAEPGTSLSVFLGIDRDIRAGRIDQDRLSYRLLSGNESGHFHLDQDSGELRIDGILDFEQNDRYFLTVEISDQFVPNPGVITETLTVQLLDEVINDATEDADGNGIFDLWEARYGASASLPQGDLDGDLVPNFFEFLSGGDPLVADASGLGFRVGTGSDGAGCAVTWRVRNGFLLGQDYLIQESKDLTDWSILSQENYRLVSVKRLAPGLSQVTLEIQKNPARTFLRLRSGNEEPR